MQLDSFSHLAALFEAGLTNAVSELRPERAFVAYRAKGTEHLEFPTPFATHGFSMAGLYVNEDISTTVISKTLRDGVPQLIVDAVSAPGLTNKTSVILSGLRSVLAVPLRHSSGLTLGLLYVDNRVKIGAFKEPHKALLESEAQRLVAQIGAVEQKMKATKGEVACHEPFPKVKSESLLLAEQGRFTQALGTIESFIFGRQEGEELGLAYGVKSHILQQMGQPLSSLEAAAVSVYLLGQTATSRSEHYPLMLNNLAGIHVEMNNLRRAHGLLTAATAHWARLASYDSKHNAGLCAAKYNLGKLHQQLKEPKEARAWFEQALVVSQETYGAEHPRTVKIQEALSEVV